MSNKSDEFGAFVAGFLVGGLIGAATALLMAPQSGEETRAIISEKSIELKDAATTAAEDAIARAEAAAAEARAYADEMKSKAEEAIANIQKAQTKAVDEIEEAAEEAVEEATEEAAEEA
jgi:gas vesicle protein